MYPSPVDAGLFYEKWATPPSFLVLALPDGADLFILIALHVDDGLVMCSSATLYNWLITSIRKEYKVKDMGPAMLFLGMSILRDWPSKRLWLGQEGYVSDLLLSYNMLLIHPSSVPLQAKLHTLPLVHSNSVPNVLDDDIKKKYQSLVGSILYLTVCS